MRIRNMVPLENRITYNRKEFAEISGCSMEVVDKWIHDGIPCIKEGRMFIFERESAIQWLRNRALRREGLVRKNVVVDDDIFPGIELA